MKQNLLQLFSSITFTQHFWYCCPKEEPRRCSVTCNTFIISQSEKTGSYRVISWVSLKRQNTPRAQRTADSAHPCWFTEELRGGPVLTRGTVTATESHAPVTSIVTLNYFLGANSNKMCSFHREGTEAELGSQRSTRRKWGCTSQCSQADPSHTAHQSHVVTSWPQDQPVQTPTVLAQDRILPHPWLLELELLNNLQHKGPPTLLPAQFFCKDYFKFTDKKATLFSMT